MVTFHQGLFSSHCKPFYLLDQIKSNCMCWLYWKSEKDRTEPYELDELKCSKSLQTTSYAHWHAFVYFHAHIKYLFIYRISNKKKQTELNELNEQKCSKTPSQMSSYAHKHVFLYLHAQTCIKTFIHLSHFKSEKQTEWNELNELKCSKTPSQMSSYAHKHVFLYLHAQTNLITLLYWSYLKS